MNRRNFMQGILALGMAPAIVRAGSLMPIVARPLIVDLCSGTLVSCEQMHVHHTQKVHLVDAPGSAGHIFTVSRDPSPEAFTFGKNFVTPNGFPVDSMGPRLEMKFIRRQDGLWIAM